MIEKPIVGQRNEMKVIVTEEKLASHFVPGTPQVFGTPALVGLIEQVTFDYLKKYLDSDETSVGTSLELKHLAPTPKGSGVQCECNLLEIDERKYVFNVIAWDDKEKIAEARHERFVVNRKRFLSKVEEKSG